MCQGESAALNFTPELIFRRIFRLGELIRADSGVYGGHNANVVGRGAKRSVTVRSAAVKDTPPQAECRELNERTKS